MFCVLCFVFYSYYSESFFREKRGCALKARARTRFAERKEQKSHQVRFLFSLSNLDLKQKKRTGARHYLFLHCLHAVHPLQRLSYVCFGEREREREREGEERTTKRAKKKVFFVILSFCLTLSHKQQLRHQGHPHDRERALRLRRRGYRLRPRGAGRRGRRERRGGGARARTPRRGMFHFWPAVVLRVLALVSVVVRAHDAGGGHRDASFRVLLYGRGDAEDGRGGRGGCGGEGEEGELCYGCVGVGEEK